MSIEKQGVVLINDRATLVETLWSLFTPAPFDQTGKKDMCIHGAIHRKDQSVFYIAEMSHDGKILYGFQVKGTIEEWTVLAIESVDSVQLEPMREPQSLRALLQERHQIILNAPCVPVVIPTRTNVNHGPNDSFRLGLFVSPYPQVKMQR